MAKTHSVHVGKNGTIATVPTDYFRKLQKIRRLWPGDKLPTAVEVVRTMIDEKLAQLEKRK